MSTRDEKNYKDWEEKNKQDNNDAVKRLRLKPGDCMVVETDKQLTQRMYDKLKKELLYAIELLGLKNQVTIVLLADGVRIATILSNKE
jgi:hypothetical protein